MVGIIEKTTFLTLPRMFEPGRSVFHRTNTLPGEIRDIIYHFTFTSTTVNIDQDSSGYIKRNSGILATCHQTRVEAIKAYYQDTCFHAPKGTRVYPWSKRLPDVICAHIRVVQRGTDVCPIRQTASFIRIFVEALEMKDPRIEFRKVLRVKCRVNEESELEWYSLEEWEETNTGEQV